jgi:hypothetical protein
MAIQILENLFPELKESEDERIRKELINYFTEITNNICAEETIKHEEKLFGGKCRKWVAWLEKQGEHAKFRDSIQIGDNVTRNKDGVLVNLSQLQRVAKPANNVKPKFKIGDVI